MVSLAAIGDFYGTKVGDFNGITVFG